MYAVGRVGTYIAQSVYSVSGPFHPFGGAVDIIVVQQEDGTFKSSPWYVKFGKFQGVLKRREKKVVVAVNDGDASFHMYLDHKGEAYFLKDAQGDDDAAAVSPTEAASSGDESSSHMLAIEYPRREEGAHATAEHAKEESEDERGDDLELRFEGREASKQLIQQSVEERETATLVPEEINVAAGNFTGDLEIQESPRTAVPGANNHNEKFGAGHETGSNTGQVMHALLNKAVGLEAAQKSAPARALLANAVLAAVQSSSLPDDTSPNEASTKVRKTASNNGMIMHGLLNQAVGLQPSHKSGPASALIARAALASLRKAVSDPKSDDSSNNPHNHPKLVELTEGDLDSQKNRECALPGSPGGEWVGEPNEVVPVPDSVFNSNAVGSLPCNGNNSDDVRVMKTVSSLGSFSVIESDVDEPELKGPFLFDPASLSSNSQFFDVMKTLEVRKLEIRDETVVVEVQEHVEKDIVGSLVGEDEKGTFYHTGGRVERVVIDREEIMEKVHDLQDSSRRYKAGGGIESKDAQKLEAVYEQDIISEEAVDQNISVHVDQLLVASLKDALSPNNVEGPRFILAEEKDITTAGKEVALISSENNQDVCSPEVTTAGKEITTIGREVPQISPEDVKDVCSPKVSTAGKELALLNPLNLSDVSSPRLKAAIELEVAWREVMEKAAATLKGAPYMNKKLNHSQSHKKKGPTISESGQKKPDGLGGLPEQYEKKSWWFWGANSAPQPKRTGEQSTPKDRKNVLRESSMERRVLNLGNDDLTDQPGVAAELEDVTKSRTHAKQGVGLFEGSGSNAEAEEKGPHIESDLGPTEGRKAGTDSWVLRDKPEDQSEFTSDSKAQNKAQGGPARRRSIFGLLSRSNTNQSSLSSASSLQSNEDLQPILDGLRSETSVERAESVVDLLEEKWARGSDAHKGLMAIARIPDARITKENCNMKVEIETFEAKNAGAALKLVDGSCVETTGTETAITPLVCEHDESSSDQVTVKDSKAEGEDTGGHQFEIEVALNGSHAENTSTTVVSDKGPSECISTSDTDVVLMSIDGHLRSAPLGIVSREAPQATCEFHEKVDDEGVDIKRAAESPPHRVVCFADVLEERPSLGSDTHHVARNGVRQMQQGKGVRVSGQDWQELDGHVPHLAIEGITGSCEGLKDLAKLVAFDSVGESQPKIGSLLVHDNLRLASESTLDQLGHTSESGVTLEINGDDQGSVDTTDHKEFEDMRAMVFEKLEEPGDGDAQDLNQGELERYYSSKDLEEDYDGDRGVFKRNMSAYMDAISGEDEQESAGSAHEDDLDHSRDKSSPIGIPGAQERAQIFPSLNDTHMLRSASESLPNATHHMANSEMASQRLTLSRSLDSAPLPSVLPPEMREQSASSRLSTRSPVQSEMEVKDAIVAERTHEKVKGASEQLRESTYEPGTQNGTTGITSSGTDDGGKSAETGFELSLCRHLLTERMGLQAAAQVFAVEKVSLDEFKKSGSDIAANDKLVVRVGVRYYPWVVAAPVVLGILAFGQVLIAPNEGAVAVEQPIVVFDGKAATSTLTTISSGGWKLWPFGGIRRPKTPEKGNVAALVSRDALMVATEAALKSSLTQEYLRMAGYYKRPRKVRTNSPSSQQLASLNLREGSNKITFTFVTRMLGKQQVDARIYLWKWNTRIVISDVDGTITKSDVLGQVMPLVGKDWTQSGVARLFSAIKKNGYELMFLSARAISQAYLTRQFLENIKQDGEVLPDGPVVISPDGLFPSLYREVIRRAPHEFKIACLEDIKSLFPPESKPFYAGFGNRDTDELSYLKVGISKGKIFIINPKGEVVVNNQVDVKSYTSLHKLVDDMFPAMSFTEQEDYNEWNFWKLPLPDIEDESSVKSSGSSSSRRGVKSGRHS